MSSDRILMICKPERIYTKAEKIVNVFQESQHKEMERAWRIAKEISNLIVYCRSVAFNIDRLRQKGFIYNEMSSFSETKAEKLLCQQEVEFFVKYHQVSPNARVAV